MFKNSLNYCLGRGSGTWRAELLDGYQERGDYGEGSDGAVLGGCD